MSRGPIILGIVGCVALCGWGGYVLYDCFSAKPMPAAATQPPSAVNSPPSAAMRPAPVPVAAQPEAPFVPSETMSSTRPERPAAPQAVAPIRVAPAATAAHPARKAEADEDNFSRAYQAMLERLIQEQSRRLAEAKSQLAAAEAAKQRAELEALRTRMQASGSARTKRQGVGSYAGVGGGHWVTQNVDMGTFIILEDGSLWEIDPFDKIDAMLWLPISDITVIQSSSGSPGYDYLLINTDDGEKAHAKYVGKT